MVWTVTNLHATDYLACCPPRPTLGTMPLEVGENSHCIHLMSAEWINYLYYNQQHFNYTRYDIKGLAEHLDATILMAWQNRLGLDVILTKSGDLQTD